MADQLVITAGRAQPLGATVDANGVNFSVYSEHATSVQLLLFADHDEQLPSQVIDLDPEVNHSFHFWHAHVSDIGPGQVYAYRMDGPKDTSRSGCRFNPNKVLIDPYALGNVNTLWDRGQAVGPQDNVTSSMRSIVLDPDDGLVAVNADPHRAVLEAVSRLSPGFSLVTLYYGQEATLADAETLARAIHDAVPGLEDVAVVHGGQPHYRYLVSAE